MNAYSKNTLLLLRAAPNTLGTRLGKLAVRRGYSVIKVAAYTGATRQSIYNWYAGHKVSPAYVPVVKALVQILKTTRSSKCTK